MNIQATGQQFQLIDNDGGLVPDQEKCFEQFKMDTVAKDYFTLGIIGAQSSGKSTLLNAMFGTGFSVMDSSNARKQTTKGIWCSHQSDSNILIMDIEGADSAERWDGKSVFERSTALFGLVISNVLVINLWCNEIGRFSASNYEIIKVIFELNIKLFRTDIPKVLLFCIRDFNKESENFENITNTLSRDVKKLWDEINKPAEFLNSSPTDYFHIGYYPLSHYKFQREKFNEDVKELSSRFMNKDNEKYYWNHIDNSKNIPFDGLYKYIEQVWESIRENKELNLPNQKIMVSNYRCQEEKATVMGQNTDDFNAMRKSVMTGITSKLAEEMSIMMNKSVRVYQHEVIGYDADVAKEKQEELERELKEQFTVISKIQIEKIITKCIKDFKQQLKMDIRNTHSLAEIIEGTKNVKFAITNQFNLLQKQTLFETDSTAVEEESKANFNLKIGFETVEFVRQQLDLVYSRMMNDQKNSLDVLISNIFKDVKPGWWLEFLTRYEKALEKVCKTIDDMGTENEDLKSIFNEKVNHEKKREFFLLIRETFMRKFKNYVSILMEKFKRNFEKTADGLRLKEFKLIPDEVITQDFEKSKEYVLKVYNEVMYVEFPAFENEGPLKIIKIEDEENLKYDLEEKMQDRLQRAMNLKYNAGSLNKLPKWIWQFVAFFARHDIYALATTPTFMVPISLLAIVFFYAYKSGHLAKIQVAIDLGRKVLDTTGGSAPPQPAPTTSGTDK